VAILVKIDQEIKKLRNATVRVPTDGYTDTLTDWKTDRRKQVS